MKRLALLLAATLAISACESSRTIATKANPAGEEIRCVGVTGKGKRAGIEYDYSTRNIIVGVVFFEIIAPPLIVLLKEFECPVADTSTVAPR